MKNPYEVLGLPREASEDELQERYKELKGKYSEDRFLTGEAGNEAARKLTELETAWESLQAEKKAQGGGANRQQADAPNGPGESAGSGFDYGYIDELIKKGGYDEAQGLLDGITERTGEWHYLQSIIYYKREWMSDCRKQLVMALEKDPRNEKYRTALEKLDMVTGNPNTDPRTMGADPNTAGQPDNGQMNNMGNCLSNCCLAYCCTDCCCSMTRCCG